MQKDWLEARLAEGRSIESIAHEVGKHSSTVGYWVKKHGLASSHAERHGARGGLERGRLEELVRRGLSSRQIAREVGRSQATVNHWLKQHGLRTQRSRSVGPRPAEVLRICPHHGEAVFVRYGATDHYRCLRCRRERVIARRRRVKEILVAEAGGECAVCGYARYAGALHFHHRDPSTKRFGLALNGVARSISRAREEAAKCVLLCANCHAEVEADVTRLPLSQSQAAPAQRSIDHIPG
jgi:transposase